MPASQCTCEGMMTFAADTRPTFTVIIADPNCPYVLHRII